MKKDKFKKLKLQIQTLEPISHPDSCVLLMAGLEMEAPEPVNYTIELVEQKKTQMQDGTLMVEMEGSGLQSDHAKIRNLRMGKQAEILDYNYFKSRLPVSVITDVNAEIFSLRQKRNIPFAIKKLEFTFNNGKKVEFTDKVSVFSLDKLAS